MTTEIPIFIEFDKILGLVKKLIETHALNDPDFEKSLSLDYSDEAPVEVEFPVIFKKGGEGTAKKTYGVEMTIRITEDY